MNRRTPPGGRSPAVRALALVAATLLAVLLLPSPSARAAALPALSAKSVTMSIADVQPNTPASSHTKQPLTIVLSLRNNTLRTLRDIDVSADRGDPITTQSALDSAITKPTAPDPNLVAHVETVPLRVTLAPSATLKVTFRTTTDIPRDAAICLCHDAIYPLYFTTTYTANGTTTTLGAIQTYVPAFGTSTPAPVLVGWVWPLLDRPHRLLGDQTFLDDELATEVAAGGRLYRMLQIVSAVAAQVSMTLVVDPDLIDELTIMSTGNYRVDGASGATIPGTGGAAATEWLRQLRAVLDENPAMELDFTPFGDPDVQSLDSNGFSWTDALSPSAQTRVTAALGDARTALRDIAWPVNETLSLHTLTKLVRQGTRTVIVNDATLRGGKSPSTDALAPVETAAGSAIAAVTSSTIEKYVARVLRPGGSGLGGLPELVAEVAIRAVQSMSTSHFVVIVPPRYIDAQPATAIRAILATAHTSWSKALPLRMASHTVTAVDHGSLRLQANSPGLPRDTLAAIRYIDESLPGLVNPSPGESDTFLSTADSAALLGPIPAAVQRTASSALLADPQLSVSGSSRLRNRIKSLRDGVHLVTPANGAYTLTSSNSPLPITITNRLAVQVKVRMSAVAADGVPGFGAGPIATQTIAPGATEQVKIPAQVDRTGRFLVRVDLTTPNGLPLGSPITLSVRNTALGTVGVAITTAAGIVLILALIVRAIGYLRRRGMPPTRPAAAYDDHD